MRFELFSPKKLNTPTLGFHVVHDTSHDSTPIQKITPTDCIPSRNKRMQLILFLTAKMVVSGDSSLICRATVGIKLKLIKNS